MGAKSEAVELAEGCRAPQGGFGSGSGRYGEALYGDFVARLGGGLCASKIRMATPSRYLNAVYLPNSGRCIAMIEHDS